MPMSHSPAPPRRGRPGLKAEDVAETRARIARIAETLFLNEGFAAVSMRRLAQEAGCAPMTLYAYFESKADILGLIWAGFLTELFDDLDRHALTIADPRKRLLALSARYVRYWLDHPDRYRMVFMTEGVTQTEVGAFIGGGDILSRYQLFAKALLEAGVEPARLKLAYDALMSCLIGVAQNHITITAYAWTDGEALAQTLADAILAQDLVPQATP